MRKVIVSAGIIILLIVVASACASTRVPVNAAPRTIFVPEDYSTIQEAIAFASDGDVVSVKNGVYLVDENTTIVINKTLTLIGEDPKNTVILGASPKRYENGIAIRLAAPNSTISGFTIANFGVAVSIANYYAEPYPSGCKIVNNNILNNSEGIRPQRNDLLISGNNITNNNSGITGYNTENIMINRNNITENGYGTYIGICKNITISENQISNNTGGINLYYYGPHFVSCNNVTNNGWGIRFAEACSNATVYDNNITQKGIGVALLNFPNAGDIVVSGVGNIVYGNLFINNAKQVTQQESNYNYPSTTRMGTDIVSWDNGAIGNYWTDYSGLDDNDDGIGDEPYFINEDNKDNYPFMTPERSLSPTPQPSPSSSPKPTPTLEPTPTMEPVAEQAPFSTTLIISFLVVAAVVGLCLLVYLKKHGRNKNP